MSSLNSPIQKCTYCKHHNLSPSPMFDNTLFEICKCCGTNITKERERENNEVNQAAAEASGGSNEWGGTMPFNIQMGEVEDLIEEDIEYSHMNPKRLNVVDKICHKPSIKQEWLPGWFISMAHEKGFCFNDIISMGGNEKEEVLNKPIVSVQVARLWKRVMPNSTCWQIHIPNRAVAFDLKTGEVAGAVYFDIGNKYIACVGVDDKYRRRSLGSLLVILAVTMCESSNALMHGNNASSNASGGSSGLIRYGGRSRCFIAGARPNLCVSPKDIISCPHLNEFYHKLGFSGGKGQGGAGNYVLTEEAGRSMLANMIAK